MTRLWMRHVAIAAAFALIGVGVAACGTDATQPTAPVPTGQEPASPATPLQVWAVESGHSASYETGVERWNAAHPDQPIELQLMPNDDFKAKIRVVLGTENAPDLFYTWGGGGLKEYVDAGYVEAFDNFLGDHPDLFSRYLPATLGPAQFDGKTYGLPIANMQPAVLFYNTKVFADAGATPPATWDDLNALVTTFNDQNIAPLTLAGQSKWPMLPYIAYLVDRVGGPEVFDRIASNTPDSWNDPAVIQALTMIQDLVKSGGITKDFSSLAYETGAADALLYTDKAAMLVMLASAYGNINNAAPEFVSGGGLDATAFPAVPGGKGDPGNLTGNPSVYWALNANSTAEHKATAAQFFDEEVLNDTWAQEILDRGGIPPVVTIEDKLAGGEYAFQKFIFELVGKSSHFQMSWDQALSPAQGEALNTQLDRVFLLEITPQQFVDELNKTIAAS